MIGFRLQDGNMSQSLPATLNTQNPMERPHSHSNLATFGLHYNEDLSQTAPIMYGHFLWLYLNGWWIQNRSKGLSISTIRYCDSPCQQTPMDAKLYRTHLQTNCRKSDTFSRAVARFCSVTTQRDPLSPCHLGFFDHINDPWIVTKHLESQWLTCKGAPCLLIKIRNS